MIKMTHEKDLKRLFKNSFEDKLKNTIMMLMYLKDKAGETGVREYCGKAIPKYLFDYEGLGGAKLLLAKAWLKTNPHGYLKKITDDIIKSQEFIIPLEKYTIIQESKKELITKIDCDFIRALEKSSKKFKCAFNMRDCYCNEACIPMMTKVFENFFLKLEVELIKEGCVRKVLVPNE
jgi:hypothetical protein